MSFKDNSIDFSALKRVIDSPVLDRRVGSIVRTASVYAPKGYSVNPENVLEMLTLMGVPNAGQLVDDAIGYFSSHGMEITMENLDGFLKKRGIF